MINKIERNIRRDFIFEHTDDERCPECGCLGVLLSNGSNLRCPQCDEIWEDRVLKSIKNELIYLYMKGELYGIRRTESKD